jgi:hypothetical protein
VRSGPLLLAALAAALLVTVPAASEVIEQGNLVISLSGKLTPTRLPRDGTTGVSVSLSAQVSTLDGGRPPQLRTITLDINRHGRLFDRGLPVCRRSQLEFTTTAGALAACGDALVGRGHVAAKIIFPQAAPLPSEGELLVFNGRAHGRRVVFGHVYGTDPVPVTSVVPMAIDRARGQFGVRLTTELPEVAADWGYVTSFDIRLGRRFKAHGRKHSYLNAGCPAPKGFPGATFILAHASYSFDDGERLSRSLVRSCKVRGR